MPRLERIDRRRTLCQDCFCRWHCAGDCYVSSFGEDGSFDEFDARCHANRAITAQLLLWNIMESGGVWQGQNGHGLVRRGAVDQQPAGESA